MSRLRYFGRLRAHILTLALIAGSAAPAAAQAERGTIDLATGGSSVLETSATVVRVAIANPAIIDVLPVTARELVINGKAAGTTSLLVWDAAGTRASFNVRVSPDAANLENDLRSLFPGEDVRVRTAGKSVVLTGTVSNSGVGARMRSMAAASLGDSSLIVSEMQTPRPGQILLKVRFAEVNRSGLERAGINLLYQPNGNIIGSSTGRPVPFTGAPTQPGQSLSDAANLFAFIPDLNLTSVLAALESNGLARTLSEPNLLAAHGVTASFLAGGEFPFPVLQSGSSSGGVSIIFKEFGIKLDFTPFIMPGGNIRLQVAPEVSSLDFANGLTISGFNIPLILSRKAKTEIELADGQTFAIAGLLDHNTIADYDKIPLLGDIPILGSLFRSKEIRQNRTELLVLVTPVIVWPSDDSPPIPTGEPDTWKWERHLDGPVPAPGDEGKVQQLENERRMNNDDSDVQMDDAQMDELSDDAMSDDAMSDEPVDRDEL